MLGRGLLARGWRRQWAVKRKAESRRGVGDGLRARSFHRPGGVELWHAASIRRTRPTCTTRTWGRKSGRRNGRREGGCLACRAVGGGSRIDEAEGLTSWLVCFSGVFVLHGCCGTAGTVLRGLLYGILDRCRGTQGLREIGVEEGMWREVWRTWRISAGVLAEPLVTGPPAVQYGAERWCSRMGSVRTLTMAQGAAAGGAVRRAVWCTDSSVEEVMTPDSGDTWTLVPRHLARSCGHRLFGIVCYECRLCGCSSQLPAAPCSLGYVGTLYGGMQGLAKSHWAQIVWHVLGVDAAACKAKGAGQRAVPTVWRSMLRTLRAFPSRHGMASCCCFFRQREGPQNVLLGFAPAAVLQTHVPYAFSPGAQRLAPREACPSPHMGMSVWHVQARTRCVAGGLLGVTVVSQL